MLGSGGLRYKTINSSRGILETRMLAGQHTLHSLADVDQEVETIGYLYRIRSSLSPAISVNASAVSADYLHARMLTQPGSKAFCSAIRKEINRPVSFEIHQDCPVAPAFKSCPVIHTKHLRNIRQRHGSLTDKTYDGGSARTKPDSTGKSSASGTAESEAHVLQSFLLPVSPSCPDSCQIWEALGEDGL